MQPHQQTTTDTGFAAHLIKRRYPLTAMDGAAPRGLFTFDMTAAQYDKERDWYDVQGMGSFVHILKALNGATRGREVHEKALANWPCLAVANQAAEVVRSMGGQS